MKEKKYHLQEDHGAAFAEEPTPAYHENTTVVSKFPRMDPQATLTF